MKRIFRLEGLGCASCAAKIERAVGAMAGVTSVSVNFIAGKMIIEGDDARLDEIVKAANAIVGRFEPDVVVRQV